jgi:3'-phosphoadenosine 5'-phosphosulfate sulfotransferase (PAPS reductase)/FAD synthetase
MHDPFKIDAPTCISFSVGRTSAYMLWRVLQSNHGLPDDAKVCFANTGKEDVATLEFVQRCSDEWGVPITWLEYRRAEEAKDRFAVVDFATASRNGEPFEQIIKQRNFLPNPVARFCTVELKIQPEHKFLKSIGWSEWDNFVGIRADEPRRVAKIKANPSGGKSGPERVMPLACAGVTKEDVGAFWRNSSFDLELPNHNGVTYHGNCDLCFLKGGSQILSLIAEKPSRAIWWAAQENSISNTHIKNGGLFRSDRPSYSQMLKFSQEQRDMFDPDEEGIACFCGD